MSQNIDNNLDELMKLRQEMNGLRHALDSQRIVNDRLMRTVMSERSGWIGRLLRAELILLPLIILVFCMLAASGIISWGLCIFTVAMCALDVASDFQVNRLRHSEIMTMPLLALQRLIVDRKKLRRKRLIISCIAVLPFLLWLGYDTSREAEYVFFDYAFIIFGGLVGLLIAFGIYRRMQRTDDAILAEINYISHE